MTTPIGRGFIAFLSALFTLGQELRICTTNARDLSKARDLPAQVPS
jgi:hypothetical protein